MFAFRALAAAGIALAGLVALTGPSAAETKLRISLQYPGTDTMVTHIRNFADKVAERSQGSLTSDIYTDFTLFKQGQAWFVSRRALLATLGIGAAMYAFLYSGLNPVLRVAVAAYVVVIALMAAQAIGRATTLRDRASVGVAVGACFFMLSDSLLATNRFAVALPYAQVWVLSTYYLAQGLMARHASQAVSVVVPDAPGGHPVRGRLA